jgi:hypothetical protein
MLALQDAGRAFDAWAAVGVDMPEIDGGGWRAQQLRSDFAALDVDPSRLLAAARELGGDTAWFDVSGYAVLRLRGLHDEHPAGDWLDSAPPNGAARPGWMPIAAYRRPIDLHLLRFGLLSPAGLHPLVGPVLAPFWNGSVPSAGDPWAGPVRVRCGGQWHELGWDGGRLRMPHSGDERRREEALRALGGEPHGCFAAALGWRDRSARLPRRLEEQRRDLMLRAQHGDVDGVLRLLDAGVDPHGRDPHGRTLLHLLPELLPRLLAAGLDVDERDLRGRTPLFAAIHAGGPAAHVRALIDAGARTDVTDFVGDTLSDARRFL